MNIINESKLKEIAPSIFSTEKASKLGNKYSLVQTIDIESKMNFAKQASLLKFKETETPVIKPEDLLRPRRTFDHNNDLWTVFNVIQENLIRGGLIQVNRRKTRGINGIYDNVRINTGLWGIAERMETLAV